MYSIGECAMIYGFLLLITAIGVLFLLQFGFFSKGFYNKYTLHAKATVKSTLGSHIGTPVITYAAVIDGKEEILTEQSSIGAPFYIPALGEEVDVYIHPDPGKTVSLAYPPGTVSRVFGCEKRFKSLSKFYLGMGLAFAGAGLLGIVVFTVNMAAG